VGQDGILRGARRSAGGDHVKQGRFGESAAGCQLTLANPPHILLVHIWENYMTLGTDLKRFL
jgi:hypothetical protein